MTDDEPLLDRPRVRFVAAIGCVALIAAAAVSIGVLCLWMSWRGQHRRDTAEYAARVTGLPLEHAAILDEEDDAELSTQMRGRVEPSVAAAIARDLPRVDPPTPWPGRSFFREEVLARFSAPTRQTALYGIHGCRPGNEWFGYIEPETGTFWLEIQYPDWGGDPPGCNPPPWDEQAR